ncbi:MAG: NYN domain-containing protein [Actinomycetota bacterium]
METIRSALFVDFDNVFGGLFEQDRSAAMAFARQPEGWLARLHRTDGTDADGRPPRRFVLCRAYLNPEGTVRDTTFGNDNGNLYLQRFRSDLTNAGIEVIDCPPLTKGGKNAADIRIVIDVLAAVEHGLPIDEVIIASSDADFTPLLYQLRARDRRTTIITTSPFVEAYGATADSVIGADELLALVRRHCQPERWPVEPRDPEEAVLQLIVCQVGQSDEPVLLSNIGHAAMRDHRTEIERTAWFGCDGLSAFIRRSAPAGLQWNQRFIWDPERHRSPPDDAAPADNGGPDSVAPAEPPVPEPMEPPPLPPTTPPLTTPPPAPGPAEEAGDESSQRPAEPPGVGDEAN